MVNAPPYQIAAKVPTTTIEGNWVAQQKWPFEHDFKVTVELADAIDVAKRIDAATSSENAGLDRDGNYLFARFSRKNFAWGGGFHASRNSVMTRVDTRRTTAV